MTLAPEPFPAGPYRVEVIGDVPRIVDRKGRDVMREPGGMERLVACANALSKIWYPQPHIDATEAYIKRLEGLVGSAARPTPTEAPVAEGQAA